MGGKVEKDGSQRLRMHSLRGGRREKKNNSGIGRVWVNKGVKKFKTKISKGRCT